MNKIILITLATLFAGIAQAQVVIKNEELGSGTPNITNAYSVANVWDAKEGLYHAPQYLPGYPTSATIWPRVVDVNCKKGAKLLTCEGYEWTPELGRGEYLLFRTHIVEAPIPQVVERIVEKPVDRIVIKEVPVKKKAE